MAKKTIPSILAGATAFCLIQCAGPTENGPGGGGPLFRPIFSATSAQVADFLAQGGGGPRAKLVFVDRTGSESKLSYIDYSESQPIIRRIEAASDPRVPMLSPDGEWVVYAKGEGAETGTSPTQRSSVHLARLAENAVPVLVTDSACEPRFVQDVPAGKLGIVFPTHCPDAAWEGHGRTLEVEIDISGSAPVVGIPKVLHAGGSYTGGLSHDRKYLCGGGVHVAMLALEGGKDRPDTLSHRGVQSCNASISSSRIFTHTMLYLNFPRDSTPLGGPAPILNGGRPWSEWQAILISAYPGSLVRGYMAPDKPAVPLETDPPSFTGSKWHHPEWSNHPYFAAATLNADRYFKVGSEFKNTAWQERVYAINLRDSATLELLRPDTVRYAGRNFGGFFWPSLWVEVPAGFQEDAGWLDPP